MHNKMYLFLSQLGNVIGTFFREARMSTYASFYYPRGLALDINDNLYVCDTYDDAIRMITPEGLVTYFAGGNNGMSRQNNFIDSAHN